MHVAWSTGKLDLYVAAAGFHPRKVLPCVVDVGTDNVQLRSDPLYMGLDCPRLKGQEYTEVGAHEHLLKFLMHGAHAYSCCLMSWSCSQLIWSHAAGSVHGDQLCEWCMPACMIMVHRMWQHGMHPWKQVLLVLGVGSQAALCIFQGSADARGDQIMGNTWQCERRALPTSVVCRTGVVKVLPAHVSCD